jgi:putative flippase GtrA
MTGDTHGLKRKALNCKEDGLDTNAAGFDSTHSVTRPAVKENPMTTITETFRSKELGRFARFLAVGALGTCLDFGLLSFLKTLGFSTLVANTASFSAGVANNFSLNRLWTFADAKHSDWHKQLMQFLLVSLLGLALNNTIVLLLEVPLGGLLVQPGYGYLPAKVIATGVVVFWNYLANRYWTFRGSKAETVEDYESV